MGQKLVVGPYSRGLRNDVTPFNVDNESFPTLINAYQWRGRIKRKRGTSLLGRLQRYFNSTSTAYSSNSTATLVDDGSGNGIVTLMNAYNGGLQTNGAIIPGSVTITDTTTGNVYTDDSHGNLTGAPSGSGTINYATSLVKINGAAGDNVQVIFLYYPDIPVMGLRDFIGVNAQFPGTIGFDTTYSYNISTSSPYPIYDVSFYKNPPTAIYVGYTQKTTVTPTSWNGQDYQQFYTTNYQGAMWATNGVTNPFVNTNIGMQFKMISTVTVTSGGPPAIVSLNINAHGLVVGDFLFINEVVTTTGINWQTGYVTTVTDANNVVVEFPNATIAGNGTGGIAQYLTNRSDPTKDCIRWYDGDPTNGSATSPVLNGQLGWVNYCPPISQSAFSIADLPAAIYYLVGCKAILQFKDRLLFFAPVVQTSSANSQVFLQDTIIYTQNGTPYYTCSYTNTPNAAKDTPTNPSNIFNPILVPKNQTATAPALFSDSTGFGGFITLGLDQTITTVGPNEDVIIVGLTRSQGRLVYSGNDIIPFNLFVINSELGADSTFSSVVMDKGIYSIGSRGIVITSQVESQRIDLEIPDMVFEFQETNNGVQRVCAQRDYINEWIYFTTGRSDSIALYPSQTLQYNYRDQSWAQFLETYTAYGLFRKQTGFTWNTIPYPTWNDWNEPWDAGSSSLLKPLVIGGNQHGFVILRDQGTGESNSLIITNIVGNTVTSPNHCLNNGDYVSFTGIIGTSPPNGIPYQITVVDANTFLIGPNPPPSFTYIGGGTIIRYYTPYIQTRQFPTSWSMGRKTRIGLQQYLLTTTSNSQITLLIFLSQDGSNSYNNIEFPNPVAIIPNPNSMNNSLIYSTVLNTSPDTYIQQCTNIPLGTIGNGVLTSFTFNYFILFTLNTNIVAGSVFIQVGNVATFQDNGTGGFTATGTGTSTGSSINYGTGVVTIAFTVAPTSAVTTTNFQYIVTNIQAPTAQTQQQIWHRINTSLIGDTVQLGFTMNNAQMLDAALINQTAEVELHAFILDLQPSQLLA